MAEQREQNPSKGEPDRKPGRGGAIVVILLGLIVAVAAYKVYGRDQERVTLNTPIVRQLDTVFEAKRFGLTVRHPFPCSIEEFDHRVRPWSTEHYDKYWEGGPWAGDTYPDLGNGLATDSVALDAYWRATFLETIRSEKTEFYRFQIDACDGLERWASLSDYGIASKVLPQQKRFDFPLGDIARGEHPEYGPYEEITKIYTTSSGLEFYARQRVYVVGRRRYVLTATTKHSMLNRVEPLLEDFIANGVAIDVEAAKAPPSKMSDEELFLLGEKLCQEAEGMSGGAAALSNRDYRAFLRYQQALKHFRDMSRPTPEYDEALKKASSLRLAFEKQLQEVRDQAREYKNHVRWEDARRTIQSVRELLDATNEPYTPAYTEEWLLWCEDAMQSILEEETYHKKYGHLIVKGMDRVDHLGGSSGSYSPAYSSAAIYRPTPRPTPRPRPGAMFFENAGVNPFTDTEDDALSTFAIDVDTASYTVARKYLMDGHLPDPDSIRVEEFVNYFKQDYEPPAAQAFAIHMEGAPSPFAEGDPKRLLLKVGVQGRVIAKSERRDAGLVFVVDISGSMRSGGRYRTVQDSLKILLEQLRPTDMVGIVAYDTYAEIRLAPTMASNKRRILDAIATLEPLGSTNVEAGLTQGYQMAAHMLEAGKTTRVILLADGVANTGETNPKALVERLKSYVGDGVAMTAIGVGMGNYNDALMEEIANNADGNYFYVDNVSEARRVFDDNLVGMLETIAKDMKIQVEFNPDTVGRYRLLGYENRDVADRDFRNDSVDAGEVGAGSSVTALYEIIVNDISPGSSWKFATARARWADSDTGDVIETSKDFTRHELTDRFEDASPRFKMSASVARLAEILRESPWTREATLAETAALARELANGPLAEDPDVVEFAFLAAQAEKLWRQKRAGS